jgi:hypothetical protein
MKRKEIEGLRVEGERGFMNLCKLARALGYKDEFHQLMNSDGSCVGDLIRFLEDNPGAIDAIKEWVLREYDECSYCKSICVDAEECRNGVDGEGGCNTCPDCENKLEDCDCDCDIDDEDNEDIYACPSGCSDGCRTCKR